MGGKRSIRMYRSLIDQPELIEKILIHLGLWPYPPKFSRRTTVNTSVYEGILISSLAAGGWNMAREVCSRAQKRAHSSLASN